MHKHWILFLNEDQEQIGIFKTDCRLDSRQMCAHAQALAKGKFSHATYFQIVRENRKGKAELLPVTSVLPCR